jgi:hypothetical protein
MTLNEAALFIPPGLTTTRGPVTLAKPILAIQLVPKNDGSATLGTLTQLVAGTVIEICGDGFNERTTKIRADGRAYFFVFQHDLETLGHTPVPQTR